MTPRLTSALCIVVLSALALASPASAQPATATPQISTIHGDLYRVQAGDEHTVFLVTRDGIIVSDPINRGVAVWLKEELARRFPDQPVRYVLLTHHHFDRAEGASIFKPGAHVVGHDRFNDALRVARERLPASVAALDRNHNNRIDGPELAGADASLFARDADANGAISPDEFYRYVSSVDSAYTTRRGIRLGGTVVEVVHTGPLHSPDMSAVYFPSERIVFCASAPPVTTTPFTFGSLEAVDVMAWIHAMLPLEFDTVITDRGETIARADLVALAEYLEAVSAAVQAGFRAGKTVPQIQANFALPAQTASPNYGGRDAQIAAFYRGLRLIKTDLVGAGLIHSGLGTTTYCEGATSCTTPSAFPGVSLGVAVSTDRLGVVAELTLESQAMVVKTARLTDEEFARRQTRTSFLVSYGGGRAGGRTVSHTWIGGLSWFLDDRKGLSREKEGFAPFAGRHPVDRQAVRLGLTGGVDLMAAIGSRYGLVVPVRVSWINVQSLETLQRPWDVSVGAGVSMRVLRRIQ